MFGERRISLLQLVIVIILVVSGLIYLYLNEKNVEKKSLETEFNGTIQEINDDEKGYMSVIIKDKNYYFSTSNLNQEYKVGDSLIKKKTETVITQFRNGELIDYHYDKVVE